LEKYYNYLKKLKKESKITDERFEIIDEFENLIT